MSPKINEVIQCFFYSRVFSFEKSPDCHGSLFADSFYFMRLLSVQSSKKTKKKTKHNNKKKENKKKKQEEEEEEEEAAKQ